MGKRKANLIEEDGCLVRMVHLDRVAIAREEAIPDQDLERLALVYKALGDPTRLKIVMALRRGEMCVCDLAALLNLSESATSHQIRRLKDLALVKSRRDGQILYYSLDDHHVEELIQVGQDHLLE
ncbi:MAG: ArsR family transcriptional regulator [Nitrospira bacterium SG8_3]|jgi:DNA-binding transcriptional ArsR family regulator|nr:MAG: ArsR family transcriptional regulator [Nitrospira bacterium SG8_3]